MSGRLWAAGVATACVAALVEAIGVLICGSVFKIKLVRPVLLLPITKLPRRGLCGHAAVVALAATGLAHLLAITNPRLRSFFTWIVGLATVAAMVTPFASQGDLVAKVCTALINPVIPIAIGSLLTTVLSRTVIDPERSWQRP